jgi:hypothetical protein
MNGWDATHLFCIIAPTELFMKKTILLSACLFFSAVAVEAQTTIDSVKATIDQMFRAMKSSDAALLKECFADSAILQTIARNKEGQTIIRNEPIAEFIKSVSSMQKDAADERIAYDVVKIDGPLAIAWTPYQFYFNGKFSHCGVNSFQLVRLNNGWKIQYIIDTRRRTECNP